ncbi:MAG: hypothetical protein DWH95_12190 [Planctomycetota bacterium]|nr:MAG: hypothetical protein DWH95_12190 [Planctomycetota bacterium]
MLQFTKLSNWQSSGGIMTELLKAVEAAAYRLAKAQAKRDVIQRSLNGIIAEQERRAAAKENAKKAKDV